MGFDPNQNAVTLGGVVRNLSLKNYVRQGNVPLNLMSLTSFMSSRTPIMNQELYRDVISQRPLNCRLDE